MDIKLDRLTLGKIKILNCIYEEVGSWMTGSGLKKKMRFLKLHSPVNKITHIVSQEILLLIQQKIISK